MTEGDGGIGLDEHERDGHPNEIAAPDDDGIRAFQLRARLFKQHHAAGRCGGRKQRLAPLHRQQTDVDGVETINIFFQADQPQNSFFVNLRWQG